MSSRPSALAPPACWLCAATPPSRVALAMHLMRSHSQSLTEEQLKALVRKGERVTTTQITSSASFLRRALMRGRGPEAARAGPPERQSGGNIFAWGLGRSFS